jgi:hypothetical protein
MAPVPVVFDVNVLVGAAAGGNSPFRSWPSPPPISGNAYADCLGIIIIIDAAAFGLWLSPHILDNTARVLTEGLKWAEDKVELYLSVLAEDSSRRGSPARTVHAGLFVDDGRYSLTEAPRIALLRPPSIATRGAGTRTG